MSNPTSTRLPRIIYIVLIIITLVFWCTYEGMIFPFFKKNLYARHLVNYLLLWLVGVTGYYAWRKYPFVWVRNLWLVFYGVLTVILTFLGAADLLFGFSNPSFRDFIGNLRLFFTSPVPFGILMLFAKHLSSAVKSDLLK